MIDLQPKPSPPVHYRTDKARSRGGGGNKHVSDLVNVFNRHVIRAGFPPAMCDDVLRVADGRMWFCCSGTHAAAVNRQSSLLLSLEVS